MMFCISGDKSVETIVAASDPGSASTNGWAAITAEDKNALDAAIASVEAAERRFSERDSDVRTDLVKTLDTLERLIGSNSLDGRTLFEAMLYRAHAHRILNSARARDGWPVDKAGAQQAMDDYAVLLKIAGDNGFPAAWIANVEYMAGSVAFNHLRDETQAFTYWRRCSEKQHAGCMNVVAHAALVGHAGQAIDHRLAIDLHKNISNTGTRFTCAGVFSSLSVFDMMYFLDLAEAGDKPGMWLERSLELVNRLAEERNGSDPCGRAMFEIKSYVYKLSQGDKQEAILRGILRSKQSPDTRAIAQFMLGQISAAAVMSAIRGNPDSTSRCITHFMMMWHGQVTGDQAAATEHYERMKQIGDCQSQIIYSRKYYP